MGKTVISSTFYGIQISKLSNYIVKQRINMHSTVYHLDKSTSNNELT